MIIFQKLSYTKYPVTEDSLKYVDMTPNCRARKIDSIMRGMDVFSFALSCAPQSVLALAKHFDIDMDEPDYFIFHQANKYLNEKIRKKLKLPTDKVPYCLTDYGNTGPASIPLTMISQRRLAYSRKTIKTMACSFGVGLACGSTYFTTKNIICPEVIEI